MIAAPPGYADPGIQVADFDREFWKLFPPPSNLLATIAWPPTQLKYLGPYLDRLKCRTVVIESHYIDRDYITDMALLYARCLRSYPNFTQRLHFFKERFDKDGFDAIVRAANNGRVEIAREQLQGKGYLGFSVIRPLPGSPLGRTVLATYEERTERGQQRLFGCVRRYEVNLAGLQLKVDGLAFQQQDQGVSACATAALWSALHRVAPREHLAIPTPADITEGASRYLLAEGRALPSEGLTIQQVCEATRTAGLTPLVVKTMEPDTSRAHLLGYIESGFAPVLAIGKDGVAAHAICGVGLKLGDVQPQTNPAYHFRDRASAVVGIYAHDDRLGPYAGVDIQSVTRDGAIRTGVFIKWPDQVPAEESELVALIVPLPSKVRVSMTTLRAIGIPLAEMFGIAFIDLNGQLTLNCRYRTATEYRENAFSFGLSDHGAYKIAAETVLSRYVGVIELSSPDGPVLDIVVDTTETPANPAILACVKRSKMSSEDQKKAEALAPALAAPFIA